MNFDPLITVVIPCYNHGLFISEAIASVERSTWINFEIIIVDDGSTDPYTKEVLAHLKNSGYKVKYQPNSGPGSARNLAIGIANGRYILTLDADDLIDYTYIEKAVFIMEKNEKIGMVYSYTQLFGDNNFLWKMKDYDYARLLYENIIPNTAIFRKKVWEDVNHYDVNLAGYEDWDFWIRVGSKGWLGYCINEPLIYYRKTGISRSVFALKQHKKIVKKIRDKNHKLYIQHKKRRWISFDFNEIYYKSINVYRQIQPLIPNQLHQWLKKTIRKSSPTLKWRTNIELRDLPEERNLYQFTHLLPDNNIVWKGDEKKILIILPWIKVGGVDKLFLDLIEGLHEKGYMIHVFTTYPSIHPWEKRYYTYCEAIFHLPDFLKEPTQIISFSCWYIKRHAIALVHVSNSQMGYIICEQLKKALPGLLCVDTLHMEEPDESWDYFRYSANFSDSFDCRVVVSEFLRERLIMIYGEEPRRVKTILNSVNVSKIPYRSRGKNQGLVVGFVGRMVTQKQPILFLKIIKSIIRSGYNICYVMIGDGPLMKSVIRYAKMNNIFSKGIFYGFIDDAITILDQNVDILLQPSTREGLPIVGIEAMALGIPIVASNVPGWRDLLSNKDTGFLCDNIEEYIDYIEELFNNRDVIENIALNARSHVEKYYNRDAMVSAYIELYKKLYSKHDSIIKLDQR